MNKPHFYLSGKDEECEETSQWGERRVKEIIRENKREDEREHKESLVIKAAAGPDSFPVLITLHSCPNNTPLFLR